MTIQEEIELLFDRLREDYLFDNCKEEKDSVAYGDSYAEYTNGYSDKDWKEATEYAKDELERAIKFINNNN